MNPHPSRLALVLLAAGCAKEKGGADSNTPNPPTCAIDAAPDLDPDPAVVEVVLTASALDWDPGTGVPIAGLGYGSVPGPVIEVARGNTLRVLFTNDMDDPTTIHWHGLRVPEAMDGVDQIEDPVAPGDSFTYEFVVQDAGLYWYHPHMDTSDAIERGLYGAIVVREHGETAAGCDVSVILDDVLLDDGGQIAESSEMIDAMGRLGNVLLANGRSDLTIPVTKGETVLLRLVDAANARYFRLALEDHEMTVVATDGGWLAEPYTVEDLLMAPGERYTIAIAATGEPGETYALTNVREPLHSTGAMMRETDPLGEGPTTVLSLSYGDGTTVSTWEPPVGAPPDLDAGDVAHHWIIDEAMMHVVTIDGEQWPDVPLVTVPANTASTFEVENVSEMRHPFHLHGQRLQVLAVDGEPVTPRAWKDTFDVPAYSTVTFASLLDNPGTWLYHCHILEHAESGMAGLLQVD